jgi:hypothetical protein
VRTAEAISSLPRVRADFSVLEGLDIKGLGHQRLRTLASQGRG